MTININMYNIYCAYKYYTVYLNSCGDEEVDRISVYITYIHLYKRKNNTNSVPSYL